MKKVFLVLFIILCGTFIYIKVLSLGDENSKFNQITRLRLGKYETLRTIFGLHSDGDARYWYLSGNTPLILEVAQAPGLHINPDGLDQFEEMVTKYTGRQVRLINTEAAAPGKLSEQELAETAGRARRYLIDGSPDFLVIYADDFDRQGTEIAKTYREFGMVLSNQRLSEVTGELGLSVEAQYVESALLHEFGHQLGLPHNDSPGCIMNARAEKPDEIAGDFTGNYMPTDFCDYEAGQLNDIKSRL